MRNTLTCILFFLFAVAYGLENERFYNLSVDDTERLQNTVRKVSEEDPNSSPSPTEQDETAKNNSDPLLGVFPDDVKEYLATVKKNLLLAPLILLRPLAVKAANVFNYLSHPNFAWTPGHFFQKLRDKFENLAALISQSAFGDGLDYPFPYRDVQTKK